MLHPSYENGLCQVKLSDLTEGVFVCIQQQGSRGGKGKRFFVEINRQICLLLIPLETENQSRNSGLRSSGQLMSCFPSSTISLMTELTSVLFAVIIKCYRNEVGIYSLKSADGARVTRWRSG